MKLVSAAKTDIGRKRKHNEDAHLADPELGLFVVADGMGGHAAGEVASAEAVETLRDHVLEHRALLDAFTADPSTANAEAVRRMTELAVRASAYQVFALTEMDPERKGMGTTLSLLLLLPGVAFVAHVGDSRIYMLRGGRTVLATKDHTFVAAMVANGKMTEEEARRSKHANVLLRAVGSHDYVEVDTRMLRHKPGDVFCLCSDGLHGYFQPGELEKVILPDDLETSVGRLIDLANRRGGKDNITGVLVRVEE